MSLLRSFTTRRGKPDQLSNIHLGRAASQRAGKPVNRFQISSPVALVSSTNALSFEAPDIVGTAPIQYRNVSSGSSAGSSHSAEDTDASTLSIDSNTDASSIDEASPTPSEPEPNHLSCYFKPAVDTKPRHFSSQSDSTRASFDAPAIPQRVPSHSKRAHENLHRKRSVQRFMSPPSSIDHRDTSDMFEAVEAPIESPFGHELAQLDAVAEELTSVMREVDIDDDVAVMATHDLAHYGASDYLSEIHGLIYEVLLAEDQPSWI